ncbi:hypothetical protein PVIIG_06133 [Plasmodium vivax India VII]|uniref:PIR Superfamily Protein n=1 Tax=Plasmodium vivax India VII TaxID=1077284 RepID=A0A0J9SIJ6_PLAVI|nr:hypothetical protein PVIIG_06133 [Plasmodium vivax India VII]
MEEQDEDIYFLPSVYNYKHIDNGNYYYHGDTDNCDELKRDLINEFDGVEDFCMKTTGILKNFHNLNFHTSIDEDKCEIVNYWVYNYLFNRIKKKDKRDPFEILARILIF